MDNIDNNDADFNNIHNGNNDTFNTILNVLNSTISSYNDNIRSYNSNINSLLTILNVITENIDLRDSSNLFNTINRNRDTRHRFSSPRSEPVFNNTHTHAHTQHRRHVPRSTQTNRNISPRNRNRNDLYNPLFPRITSLDRSSRSTFTPQLRLSRETILHDDTSNMESLSDLFGNLNFSFQNVPVYPSLTQIQNSTRSYNYTTQEYHDNPNELCPITMEEFEIEDEVCIIQHCNHIFKKEILLSRVNLDPCILSG